MNEGSSGPLCILVHVGGVVEGSVGGNSCFCSVYQARCVFESKSAPKGN